MSSFLGMGFRLRGLKRQSHFSWCFCSHRIINHICSWLSPVASLYYPHPAGRGSTHYGETPGPGITAEGPRPEEERGEICLHTSEGPAWARAFRPELRGPWGQTQDHRWKVQGQRFLPTQKELESAPLQALGATDSGTWADLGVYIWVCISVSY